MKMGGGEHSFQVGGNTDFMHYRENKSLNGNPIFRYHFDPATGVFPDVPFQAQYGIGDPIFSTGNNEYGIWLGVGGNITATLEKNVFRRVGTRVVTVF